MLARKRLTGILANRLEHISCGISCQRPMPSPQSLSAILISYREQDLYSGLSAQSTRAVNEHSHRAYRRSLYGIYYGEDGADDIFLIMARHH